MQPEQVYQKKTQLEHILLRPDTYIGSTEVQTQSMWIVDDSDIENPKMINKNISYVPGLYKIFDEIIVNAADNIQRDPKTMTQIKVTIDQNKGLIKVWNNGMGIPVVVHKKEKLYVPELIFGHLLTSSNYDDNQKKVTGGRNGFGAKLANIFSKKFEVECADTKNKKLFKKTYKNNMSVALDTKISDFPAESSDYTCISFEPDLKKFGMKSFDNDIYQLFKKRVYDLAGCSPKNINVYLNSKKITKVRNFSDYVDLYFNQSKKSGETAGNKVKVYDKVNSRWEVCVALSETGSFQQVSFVNSICTIRGGTHCNYIADQVVKKCQTILSQKHKKLEVKPAQIKNNLFIFTNCLIENPCFDSQTKETLTIKKERFGSTCDLSDAYLKRVLDNCGIIQSIVDFAHAKESIEMKRKLGQQGKKQQRLLGIPKLEDANLAGTGSSRQCTLILTEGDSAKTLAMSGIQIVGRDHYGVFPLKGKLLNVRDAPSKVLLQNQEIQNLMKIIGLQLQRDYSTYENFSTLRYGCIMIMTDQDHDGSHIKGLIINFFEHFWPSLLKKAGFLKEFITPIIKISKKSGVKEKPKTFFTISEYKQWENYLIKNQSNSSGLDGFAIKYYKGLGTSTASEAKEYFSDLKKHVIEFRQKDQKCVDDIRLAFTKSMADQRKNWIATQYDKDSFVDHNIKLLTYQDFINKELIHFSIADNLRSIPSVMDGLKPGQRKIIFACFKRKLRQEIKVAQLSGYVAEHSAYHHGEMSLQQTIINMAQDFVGSNNLNLLMPIGQFGTRLMGGKESASARYIFTNLNPLSRIVFPEEDDALLNQIEEEGIKIEPNYYQPILPMVLVNGAEGIGTGWSTFVPCFNPLEIIENIKGRLMSSTFEFKRMHPWYKNFTGSIEPAVDPAAAPGSVGSSYLVNGRWRQIGRKTLEISELPIKKWTRDYKNMLEEMMMNGDLVEDIKEFHTDNTVRFVITLSQDIEQVNSQAQGGIHKKFKLQNNMSANNYVLFDPKGQLKKYNDECEILQDFFVQRLQLYHARKEHMLKILKKDCRMLENKARFIKEITQNQITLNDKNKLQLVTMLVDRKYLSHSQLEEIALKGEYSTQQNEGDPNFDYLLTMPLWSLTKERIESLNNQLTQKQQELQILQEKTIKQLWLQDLDSFMATFDFGTTKDVKSNISKVQTNNCYKSETKKSQINGIKRAGITATSTGTQSKSEVSHEKQNHGQKQQSIKSNSVRNPQSIKEKRETKVQKKSKQKVRDSSSSSPCSFKDDFDDTSSQEVIIKHNTARRTRQVIDEDEQSQSETNRLSSKKGHPKNVQNRDSSSSSSEFNSKPQKKIKMIDKKEQQKNGFSSLQKDVPMKSDDNCSKKVQGIADFFKKKVDNNEQAPRNQSIQPQSTLENFNIKASGKSTVSPNLKSNLIAKTKASPNQTKASGGDSQHTQQIQENSLKAQEMEIQAQKNPVDNDDSDDVVVVKRRNRTIIEDDD